MGPISIGLKRDRFTKQNSGRVLFSGMLSEQFTKQLPCFVKNPECIFAKQSVYLEKSARTMYVFTYNKHGSPNDNSTPMFIWLGANKKKYIG